MFVRMRSLWLSFSCSCQTVREKAVHIGGALQLLFGIKGRRWDREFSSIYNDAWVRPEENENLEMPIVWRGMLLVRKDLF